MSYAVLFPGQGSQVVGMGADVFASRSDLLGPVADEVLGWSLADLCARGPDDELTRTDRAQPALFAVGFALWAELSKRTDAVPAGAAGHSLGEYTALAASGAIGFLDGLRLVAQRGEAMAVAAAREPSGMAALLGGTVEAAEALCHDRRSRGGSLWVANINAPGQVVVAGGEADLAWAAAAGRAHGIRRVISLNVAGAFHSPYMGSAAEALRSAIAAARIGMPRFPVWANATAAPHDNVRALLVSQLTSPVRFSDSVVSMVAAGIDNFVHIGPGDVTAGLARRSVEGVTTHVVSTIEESAAVAAELNASV